MNLKNCKITIEPKGEPENTLMFFNADCTFDEMLLARPESFPRNEEGDTMLDLHLAIRPAPHIQDVTVSMGYYGDPKAMKIV